MITVRPKKKLGQHFLKDENIARKIVNSLRFTDRVLEIGPGTGVLTKFLLTMARDIKLIEIDAESVEYLSFAFPELKDNIIQADFLKTDAAAFFDDEFAIIGNFPYNISSQIFFRIIEFRHQVPEATGMIQKEVAERIAAPPGNKTYGILSVLLGTFFDIEILFSVSEKVFLPPPKVKSAVIRLTRKQNFRLDCNEEVFFNIVKTAFNQRRKTLRNSLKNFWQNKLDPDKFPVFTERPEQLSPEEFVSLAKILG